jgi:methionyl-tRNA synthetase
MKQADRPCPKCGSFHRRGDHCNRCGEYAPVPEEFYVYEHQHQDKTKFQTEAFIWSKQEHKYVGKVYN